MENKTDTPEFEGYARLLREKGTVSQLPAFDPNWVGMKPRFNVEDKIMSIPTNILRFPKTVWLTAAAVLLLMIGVWSSFRIPKAKPEIVQGTPLKAVVVFVKGQASIMRDIQTELHRGDLLNESDIILTNAGGVVDIGLTDSSVIRVKENSRLILKELRENNGSQIKINLTAGRLLNVVEKEKKGSNFYVETPSAVAGVRGTSFEVNASQNESMVFVVEGTVEVISLNTAGKIYTLETTKLITVNKDGEIESINLPKLNSTLPEYKDMRKNLENLGRELFLDLRDLKSAKTEEELSRIYNLNIEHIIMKDGRELRGVVVSQKKGKLVVQTLKGTYILDENAVDKIKY
ncbi:FecR family protein [Leptospira mayottensis]|uniref:Sigma factor regulatory protein, FecR/PupR family n=2 Tax=Leptospira mayottensis TaxID=1137606 RepID=A0AA87MT05_9LEPT|nr:FecR family protein [Leptospira mayottensis]AXR60125.1 iron dicitrate transport regulator FecR [Leptospira mayottensis]AXR63626.1 iron dicitrate transport regulator FecR [Leptospira mayottensis]AZQ03454.1 iron dicitrate transport regulator FecR [Leptospira mayottensis 200901116]EKS01889.1 sigma factor regulatory protein, FecR/PupR family [Leptospira mayottensis 200901122]TGN01906.1 iron dicitrate transport regulator FecR [Leptospira mayottensis]